MKKSIVYIISLSLIFGFFCGCDDLTDSENTSSEPSSSTPSKDTDEGNTVTSTETINITCTETPFIYEIPANVSTINVTGNFALLSFKDIYLATTNPTSSVIDGTKLRFLPGQGTATNITKYVNSSTTASSSRTATLDEESFSIENPCGSPKIEEYLNSIPILSDNGSASARAAGSEINRTFTQLPRTIGQTKSLFVDYNKLSAFEQKQATLQAIGTYCNVWVINENWTTGEASATDKKVNTAIAQKVADFFDDIYSLETNLYGKESDEIFYTTYATSISDFDKVPMKTLSDTGTKVNLVILSISESSVLGYFSRKDYYPNLEDLNTLTGRSYTADAYAFYGSNEGKYLYLNAASCVEDVANVMTIVTHEYQHLINFGRKTMANYQKGTNPILGSSALNEMMAMVCEDFIKEYTKEHYESDGFTDENAPFIYRLPAFNLYSHYAKSGIEYIPTDTRYSYPNLYTFGAWCARKYGGAHLMYDIANSTDGELFPAVINSIKKTQNMTVTVESLLKEFVYDCIVQNSASGTNAFMTSVTLPNTDNLFSIEKNYGYPLESIDLWNLLQYGSSLEIMKNLDPGLHGPVYMGCNQYWAEVRPYGFFLNKIGTTQIADNFSFSLRSVSGKVASDLKTYLIIQ